MNTINLKHLLVILLLAATIGVGVTGCEADGPAEEAGERIDNMAEDAQEEMEDAADDVEDAVDDAKY